MKIFLASLLMALSWSAVAEPWVNYLGAHYRPQPWAASIRDPEGAGQFTGEYGSKQIDLLTRLGKDYTLLYSPGGLGSGRSMTAVDHHMTNILLTMGEGWKKHLQANIAKIPKQNEPVYWQFGNEINSKRFSETQVTWQGARGQARGHDVSTIPYYVEYFLAPGAEAVQQAQASDRVKVVLGSIAAAANPHAQQFLEALLNYKVEGLFAPSLKGQSVYQLVDVISVHYIASANTRDWQKGLETIRKKWLGKGRINGVWSTEEVGMQRAKRNEGATSALAVLARYMNWWQQHKFTAQQGRVFMWGTDEGRANTTSNFGLQELYKLIGAEASWQPIAASKLVTGSNVEGYAFKISSKNAYLLFAFPADQKSAAVAQLKDIESLGRISAARYFSPEGMTSALPDKQIQLTPGSLQLVVVEATQ